MLSDICCGCPQKLPYLYTEKRVAKRYTKNIMPATMCIMLFFISNLPEIKTFDKKAKIEIKTSTSNNACLLKSKTSAVHGRKKIGIKNIAA